MESKNLTGYPSIDKPWLKYYTAEAITAPLPEGTIYQYMMSRNAENLDANALNYFGKTITYRAFDRRIDECARALIAFGVKPGDFVSICSLTTPEAAILFYAVNKIGAVSNFLVLNATEEELHHQFAQSESKVVFCIDIAIDKIRKAAADTKTQTIVSVPLTASMPGYMRLLAGLKGSRKPDENIMHWNDFLAGARGVSLPQVRQNRDDLAVLEYTSGTTAESKAVMLSNRAVNAVAFHYIGAKNLMEFESGQKYLNIIPPFLSYGLILALHMPLCARLEVILSPDPSPENASDMIFKYRPNHFSGGPLHVSALMKSEKAKNADLSFLVTAAYGGDAAGKEWETSVNAFLKSHGCMYEVLNGYGLSETASSFAAKFHHTKAIIPFFKNNVKILDVDTGQELCYGQEGELCLTGPSLMDGYFKNPTETEKVLFEENGVRWLHTGDLGMVTEDGFLTITGRLKRIFWAADPNGVIFRVYPMKIEEVIATLPEIAQCAVVGKRDKDKGYLPIAYVTLHQTSAEASLAIKEKVLNICREKLNPQSQPAEVHILKQLPLTRAGKIYFKKLEEQASQTNRL